LPGHDLVRVFPQLRDITGVVFLSKDPVGLSLTAELRDELRQFATRSPAQEPARAIADDWSSPEHRLLRVLPDASAKEIKAAYRRRMKEWHPDRFVDIGEAMR